MGHPQRKNLLINKPFQLRMLLYANLVVFCLVGLFGVGIYVFTFRLRHFTQSLLGNNEQLIAQYFEMQSRSLFALLAFVSLCTFFFICATVMVLSHRIAGPLYRLNMHLNQVADGSTTNNVKFREKDFFPELADSCNRVMEKIRSFAQKTSA